MHWCRQPREGVWDQLHTTKLLTALTRSDFLLQWTRLVITNKEPGIERGGHCDGDTARGTRTCWTTVSACASSPSPSAPSQLASESGRQAPGEGNIHPSTRSRQPSRPCQRAPWTTANLFYRHHYQIHPITVKGYSKSSYCLWVRKSS